MTDPPESSEPDRVARSLRRAMLRQERGPLHGAAVSIHRALRSLEAVDPQKARIVELFCFGGLRLDEIATTLDLPRDEVSRELRSGRVGVRSAMNEDR